ncbi:hypothetical protein AVEN_201649-1 [Araneus ventricosus]|uniref:Uncharacterized protein n=1 Tax=Araneus ventricosus TaxID=182803 RepID=A0A4Y2P0M8_ARAVE|nr:hypothetical protein AVEN_201649-1 [Araneus ventricosus]
MQGQKCNSNDIGDVVRGCLGKTVDSPPAEVLGWKIGNHRDRKLTFKDRKTKISRDFPDNEAARSFVTWAPHGYLGRFEIRRASV